MFAVLPFAIDDEEIADRLGVSVTILLTFTAFQNMVDEQLPKTRATEFIDKYILIAYGIQGLIITVACLLPTIISSVVSSDQEYQTIEHICIALIVAIWIGPSLYYIAKIRNVYKDQEKDKKFWETRAKTEHKEFKKNGKGKTDWIEFMVTDESDDDDDDNETIPEQDQRQQSYECVSHSVEDVPLHDDSYRSPLIDNKPGYGATVKSVNC